MAFGLIIFITVCLDGTISGYLYQNQGADREAVAAGYWFGHGLIQSLGLILVWFAGRKTGNSKWSAAGRQGLAAFIISGVGVQVIKHLVGRPRPRLAPDSIWPVGPSLAAGFDSFPSGHTATTMAIALVFSWRFPRLAPLFFGIASFTAASRMLGGSHYPSDVLGGAAWGLASAWFVLSGHSFFEGGVEKEK